MLKMETIVWFEPMPMQTRRQLSKTTSQTELTGVFVYEFTLLQILETIQPICIGGGGKAHHHTWTAAMRHPSKTRMPFLCPPALRSIR